MTKLTELRVFLPALLVLLLLCTRPAILLAAEDGTAASQKPAEPPPVDLRWATNIETEIGLTRQALDQLRRELDKSTARNAEAITSSLSLVESTMSRMHERQMESMHNSNRTVLIIAGVFAGVGFVCLVLISLVLMRTIGRFSELSAATPNRGHLLGPGQPVAALGSGETAPARAGTAEEVSNRFQSALEQLQKRILELEQSAQPAPANGTSIRAGAAVMDSLPEAPKTTATIAPMVATVDIQPLLPDDEPASKAASEEAQPGSRVSVLLGKGQALLNLDSAESALQCFEEALALEPNHADALVKKGMALEKMQDWERALECYNRAIAADRSITVAYLYRGGVCNRLQRYREALESYEQALQTEKKSAAF